MNEVWVVYRNRDQGRYAPYQDPEVVALHASKSGAEDDAYKRNLGTPHAPFYVDTEELLP